MTRSWDVIVVGSGPAGRLAAAACEARGLSTLLLAPEPDSTWKNVYGAWVHDITDPRLAAAMRASWDRVAVHHLYSDYVQETYGCVDNPAWRDILSVRHVHRGTMDRVEVRSGGVTVVAGGDRLAAGVVIDARGGRPGLLQQVAWGELLEADGDDGEMRWMDFGTEGSFLYAMRLPEGLFVEETELATRTVGFDVLRARLHARLVAMGIRVRRTIAVERCRIPLDNPVPAPRGAVLPFGAAAAMVQPSTGYLLPRLVAAAPAVARAFALHLDRGPDVAVAAAWREVWPRPRLRQRSLHLLGAEVVAGLDPDERRAFFAAFFALPGDVRRRWLADALPPSALAMAMTRLYARLPAGLRWRVSLASFAPVFRNVEVP